MLKCQKQGLIGKCEECNKENITLTYVELYGLLCCSKCLEIINNIPVEDL